MLKFSNIIFLTLFFLSCSSQEPKKEAVEYKKEVPKITTTNPKASPDPTSKMLGSELGTDLVAKINFEEASSELTKDAKDQLSGLIKKIDDGKGSISEIQVITWGDKLYPSKEKKELNDNQKELVESRNKSLEGFFEDKLPDAKFIGISMAERPSFWGRVVASDAYKIKKSLQVLEIATTKDKDRGIKNISKSIILLFYSE